MIDTHSHIYSEEFNLDRDEMLLRARNAGVEKIILPNVDSESIPRMLALENKHSGFCYAAIGLHPTSVKTDYERELSLVRSELERRQYIAVGEIGIDLYWDKSFCDEQVKVFQAQTEWALEFNLPIIVHVRDSFRETMEALRPFKNRGLRGVFHSFTGSAEDAAEIIDFEGFMLGINGIVTFKNAGLAQTLEKVSINHLILETDAPYLAPVPFRGKRNEPAFVTIVRDKLADIYSLPASKIDAITTENAERLFFG